MISLSSARKLVKEIRGEDMSLIYTDLILRDWAREGVISHIQIKDGRALYPDIITAEILTAIRLKDDYSLAEIAEARRCLELEGGNPNQITEAELIRFINCQKLLNDKKLVTKLSLKNIESLDKIRELVDDLLKESKHLEIVGDYLKEFLKAEKKLESIKENRKKAFIS